MPIDATAILSLLQVPPEGVEPKVEFVPLHTVVVPVIGVGAALYISCCAGVLLLPVAPVVVHVALSR